MRALTLQGPDPERDGVSVWTRGDIADLITRRFGQRYHISSLSNILRTLGFSRQKARPVHPDADPKARAAWTENQMPALDRAAHGHRDQRIAQYINGRSLAGEFSAGNVPRFNFDQHGAPQFSLENVGERCACRSTTGCEVTS